DQASHESPVTSTGAFVHRIPLEVPPGIGALTPELSLSYSSHGGVGAAGVGWDLPLPAITLNQGDGTRPPTIAEDLSRYPVGSAVERYASHTGTVAVSKDQEEFASASLSYLFNPHNDATIVPIADDSGDTWRGGDPAAWLVITRDGTEYRYGTSDASSLWRDEGTSNARKVAWFLDQVTDSHGNVMRYYYETFPAGQDVYRQPVLRAIEYGIPASNVGISERLVVLFEHIESP